MSVIVRGWSPWRRLPIVWTWRMVTPPAVEPVSLDLLKQFARVQTDDENAVLDQCIRAARDKVERDADVVLVLQERELLLSRPPTSWDGFAVPFWPLGAVTAIAVTASDGSVVTVAPAEYRVVNGYLFVADGGAWPGDLAAAYPVAVRLTVGYATPEAIDPSLVQMVLMAAAHFYGPGRDIAINASENLGAEMPMTYAALLETFKAIRVA